MEENNDTKVRKANKQNSLILDKVDDMSKAKNFFNDEYTNKILNKDPIIIVQCQNNNLVKKVVYIEVNDDISKHLKYVIRKFLQ